MELCTSSQLEPVTWREVHALLTVQCIYNDPSMRRSNLNISMPVSAIEDAFGSNFFFFPMGYVVSPLQLLAGLP